MVATVELGCCSNDVPCPITLPMSVSTLDDTDSASTACCPHCGGHGSVRVSTLIMNRERHLHYHCGCCHHVWVERERRPEERAFDYQPPMVK